VLGLLVVVVPGLPEQVPTVARAEAAGVDGYPQRIGRQWWVRGLPERPGPVAALLKDSGPEGTTWYAVRADGHRWRLPEVSHRSDLWPALSDDGRLLGYLERQSGPYVVRDLVTGKRTEFPEVVEPAGADVDRGILYGQAPGYFSPDGTRLLLSGGSAVLDLPSRSIQLLREDEQLAALLGVAAGWAGEDRVVWLRDGGPPGDAPVELRAITTDLRGTVLDDVALAGTAGVGVSQWSGAVRVEDGLLAVLPDDFYGPDDRLLRFRLSDGSPVGEAWTADVRLPCAAVWAPRGPLVVPSSQGGAAVAVEAGPSGPRTLTVAPPTEHGRCLVWARDALSGEPQGGGLLLLRDAWWSWRWRELLLGAVLLPLVLAGAARLWRLPRREPAGPAEAAPDWYA
jgi:hypothetical protein